MCLTPRHSKKKYPILHLIKGRKIPIIKIIQHPRGYIETKRPPVFTDWNINIVKMFRLPKPIYKFNTASIKITKAVFITLKKHNSQVTWNYKTQRAKHSRKYTQVQNILQS